MFLNTKAFIGGAPRLLYAATSGGDGGIERASVQAARLIQARGLPVLYAYGRVKT